MTREEKCEFLINIGYTYNPETGFIYNRLQKQITGLSGKGYVRVGTTINKKDIRVYAHQFAWYWVYRQCVKEIDHINNIKIDNRICNLRSVTKQQNQWNRLTAKGYFWCKRDNNWKSQIGLNYKQIYIGSFNSEEEARNAYLAAKEKYHVI